VSELRSALVVVVPEVAPAVEPWLERTAVAKPSRGIPAHVTILFPFVPAREIDDTLLEDLAAILARFPAFEFELSRLERFPNVLYLAPEPADPFSTLTEAVVASYPAYPPYGGIFDTVVPHLTAAEGETEILDSAEADIGHALPTTAEAREVVLLEEIEPDMLRWQIRTVFALAEPWGVGVTERLRPLWDFADLDASEQRFRAQLSRETTDEGRAEVLTQLARIEGLRGEFDQGEALIEEAEALAGDDLVARTSIDLERGRLRRSSGDVEAALAYFESAYATALEARGYFIAADAAHMAALATSGHDGFVTWTRRGIELAEEHESAGYWLGPLLNNLGWECYEAGELEPALDAFERALHAREQDPSKPEPIALARYAAGKALRGLGRSDEAIPLLEQAVAWAEGEGVPDGWYHEELAEEYAAVGREDDAREQARLAIPLLLEADPGFEADKDRAGRLRALASST